MIGTSKAQALWACMAILLTAAPTATAQADALQDISFWTNSDQFPIVGVEIEPCSACERCCECGDGCCDACCDCGSACCNKRLLGLIAPSDHCFDDFISPMTNPVFFEDPRTLTEARDFPSARGSHCRAGWYGALVRSATTCGSNRPIVDHCHERWFCHFHEPAYRRWLERRSCRIEVQSVCRSSISATFEHGIHLRNAGGYASHSAGQW